MTTRIKICCYASLRPLEPPSAADHPIGGETTVGELLGDLKIPTAQIKLIFVNGRRADLGTILSDGDRLGLFPPVGGG